MATDSKAPGELELVRQFVNTRDIDDGIDEIATPAALGGWLKAQGLDVTGRLDGGDVKRTIEAREGLRALLLANNGDPLDAAAVAALNEAAPAGNLAVRFGRDGQVALESRGKGIDRALGSIYAIVFRAMAEGTWQRLKACRDDTCQWGFYDQSRNRSATWCSMEVCGNRNKARAFRERQKG